MYDRKEMFKAVCSECGNDCEVPFKPTGSKPVLCSSCFGHTGHDRSGGRDRRSFDRGNRRDRRSFDRGDRRGDREMHQVVCDECGDKCEVPFKPTAGKPIYCDKCFGKNNDRGDRRSAGRDRRPSGGGNNNAQMDLLSKKLDRIINLLESGNVKKSKSKLDAVLKEEPKKDAEEKDIKKKAAKKTTKKVAKKTVKKVTKKKK